MKVNNRVVDKPNEILLVLPREDGDLAFKFRAVTSETDFDALCKAPKPPRVVKPGSAPYSDVNDKTYVAALDDYASKHGNWQFLYSIAVTEGLEFEKVKLSDPSTWHLWREEFKNAGFSIGEVNLLFIHFLKANNLNDQMLQEARSRFLASQSQKEANKLLQTVEQSTSQSGEAVNG